MDGVNHMRIQFYVSGSKRKATVHAEAREVGKVILTQDLSGEMYFSCLLL